MDIGKPEPAIWVEPAEDPFEVPKPVELPDEKPVEIEIETPGEVEIPV